MIGNPNDILDRIMQKEKITTEAGLARFLEILPQTLGSWRTRETFNFGIILHKCKDYDLNWLFKGDNKELSLIKERLTTYEKANEQLTAKVNVLKECISERMEPADFPASREGKKNDHVSVRNPG